MSDKQDIETIRQLTEADMVALQRLLDSHVDFDVSFNRQRWEAKLWDDRKDVCPLAQWRYRGTCDVIYPCVAATSNNSLHEAVEAAEAMYRDN